MNVVLSFCVAYKEYFNTRLIIHSCKGAGSISTRSFGKAFKIAVR